MKKALIAMSGGVDSSVAALLTKQTGYECIGCTMKLLKNDDILGEEIEAESSCCSLEDVEDARSVAFKLGIPYYVFNFTDDFKENVIRPFIDCYLAGQTPNPCIECNRHMKFDKLHLRAQVLGCEKIVTGHYARIVKEGDTYLLKKALDDNKDQSYVLYNMTQELLAHTLFPLGELNKAEARRLADENGFINSDKPESQDICFVPDGDYARVIGEFIKKENLPGEKAAALCAGDFISLKDGSVLGKHKGIIHYTIGQRKGLGISAPEPLYVCKIDPDNNIVYLGSNDDLFSDTAFIKNINWISGKQPEFPLKCSAKIRYRQKEQPATLHEINASDLSAIFPESGSDKAAEPFVKLVFDEPQRAITPGQSAVFYDGDTVLGGGIII